MREQIQGRANFNALSNELDILGSKLVDLITEILQQRNIRVHAVTYRVKSEESTQRKVERSPDKYTAYGDLTDILGIRVISYFADQVDDIVNALEGEFTIDTGNTVDKRQAHSVNEFGYMSFHYIASVSSARAALIEYLRFAEVKFEVQIRSILQHAWAEIEHDLGYKGTVGIPKEFRRRFSMLAGVLEMVDKEFGSLRDDVGSYSVGAAAKAQADPSALPIDQSTIVAMMEIDSELSRLDSALADATGYPLRATINHRYLAYRGNNLLALGIRDMGHLREIINERFEHVVRFVKGWYHRDGAPERAKPDLPVGIGLFYLAVSIKVQRAIDDGRSVPGDVAGEVTRSGVWVKVIKELGPLPPVPFPEENPYLSEGT